MMQFWSLTDGVGIREETGTQIQRRWDGKREPRSIYRQRQTERQERLLIRRPEVRKRVRRRKQQENWKVKYDPHCSLAWANRGRIKNPTVLRMKATKDSVHMCKSVAYKSSVTMLIGWSCSGSSGIQGISQPLSLSPLLPWQHIFCMEIASLAVPTADHKNKTALWEIHKSVRNRFNFRDWKELSCACSACLTTKLAVWWQQRRN